MSLVKLPFILWDAISMRINATPPNPPSPIEEHIIPDWRESFLKSLAWPSVILRTIYWSVGIIEMLVILASQHPTGYISKHILEAFVFNGSSPYRIQVTPLFILGNILAIFGTVLRVKCFYTLGPFFTFELYIHKDHRLVVRGPYAFIRHPSYTGLILTIVGAYCNHATGSWVRECGALDTMLGRALLLIWLTIAGAVITSLLLRVPGEDKILQKQFGEEWEIWARKVRYKLIPGIY